MTTASAKQYYALVETPLSAVRQSLLSVAPPESQVLAGTVAQSLDSGGKYLRPVITLLAGMACGMADERLSEVAAVSEIIHIATLLHDDVLDESELRRGRQTIRAQLGNKISVLSGDYLLAQASLKLSKLGNTRLVAIYAQVLADLCDGEVTQMTTSFALDSLNSPQDLESAWASYYHKTHCKTASLFAAGCEAAGVVNGLPEEQIQHLRSYGRDFGIVFQIVDDLLDYTSSAEEMGKPVLDDLRNGIINAPVLLALESPLLSKEEHRDFRAQIKKVFESPEPESLNAVQQYLSRSNAVAETRTLMQRYIDQAIESLAFVKDGAEKQALIGLLQYVVDRRQ